MKLYPKSQRPLTAFEIDGLMSDFDRDKWNSRYAAQKELEIAPPTELFSEAEAWLPNAGRALDVAGGTGRNSWPLVARGLDVTLADISLLALQKAQSLAVRRNSALATLEIDFEVAQFPPGPWEVIIQVCFLNRALFAEFPRALARGGLLLIAQPTVKNLERHEKPPRPFLLEAGELPGLVSGLEILHSSERWRPSGRHEAWIIARRSG